MNGWTTSRRALAVAALSATAVLGATSTAVLSTAGTASADQPKTPAEIGLDQLTQEVGDNVAGKTAVANMAKTAQLVAAAKLENIQFTPFSYLAPTLGCGFNMPFSLTQAMAVSGVTTQNHTEIALPAGNVSFQALAQQNGFPLNSGLTVAWLNVNNGRSGITALDDRTEYNLPALSKTVDAGAGNVIASLWGTIDYPNARCVVLPTVGLFSVADTPPPVPQVDPAKPDSSAPTTSAAPTTPATPTTPAQAPDSPAATAPDAGSGTPAN
ncbi:hypothetical protein [Nocardia concava]|uniref:hypothetical protein n=1 Tax=Nocardia concava TaxID=257281 RepID=UPI00030BAD5C|nr:hypothetical protein [Nocardia concava]